MNRSTRRVQVTYVLNQGNFSGSRLLRNGFSSPLELRTCTALTTVQTNNYRPRQDPTSITPRPHSLPLACPYASPQASTHASHALTICTHTQASSNDSPGRKTLVTPRGRTYISQCLQGANIPPPDSSAHTTLRPLSARSIARAQSCEINRALSRARSHTLLVRSQTRSHFKSSRERQFAPLPLQPDVHPAWKPLHPQQPVT